VTVRAVTPSAPPVFDREGEIVRGAISQDQSNRAKYDLPSPSADGEGAGVGLSVWQITVALNDRCQLPAARALQVVLACGMLGAVEASQPTLEEIENSQVTVEQSIRVTVSAPGPLEALIAAARAAVERIPEVQVTHVALAGDGPSLHGNPTPVAVPPSATAPAASATPTPVPASAPAAAAPAHAATPPPAPTTSSPRAASIPVSAPLSTSGGEGPGVGPASHAPRMVRIDVERLDALMNLVGELVIDRTRLARIAGKLAHGAHDPMLAEELTETCRHLARISDDLQDEVMRSRMLPIESVFSKFPRLVRDLAQKVNKQIDFIVEGKDTELDRSVAEQIGDPIIHLLRNSIDHGVEPAEKRVAAGKAPAGQVRLAARHEENQIVIDVEDDGHGIDLEVIKQKAVSKGIVSAEAAARLSDREAVELIFASGFSTAEQISDISGRGVGMDIVRTNVERLNGTITVETEIGQGTRFTVTLPLTLAIIRALLIEVAGQTYAIPLTSVVEALRIERAALRSINGRAAISLRDQVLPLLRLRDVFADLAPPAGSMPAAGRSQGSPLQVAAESDDAARQFVVAVRWGERRGGLIVDSLIGEQEIVIKPLGKLFRAVQGVSGGAVLGDGQVAPILDIAALIKHIIAAERGTNVPQGAVA
jgi:two-component system chemotaxis sensor kinase CheA